MKTPTQCWSLAVIAAALVFALHPPLSLNAQDSQAAPSLPAPAAPAAPAADDQDPSGRVARLNYIDGDVTFQPGGESDWTEAALNRPLVTGDNLWADQNSRAELHIGSTALRLGAMTGITLLEVSNRAAQVRLVQGSLIVRVRHVDDEDSYEIDTPNVAFVVTQPGDYRIDVDADGVRTDVTVWRGRGEVTGGGSEYTVVADQHATFTGSDQLSYDLTRNGDQDGLDGWAMQRDQVEDASDSANYVSRETTGYEDLDQYGDWTYVAGYGPVWQPRVVAAGWAPYRFGHWSWVGPWGWTWVADEPWGFAPFHYGRWAFAGTNWVWVPGPSAVRPIYAPALVAWVGGAPGSHFSFSFGAGVGWVPLAPGEVFLPYYRVSRSYVNSVNLSNTHVEMAKITNVYNAGVINRTTAANSITYANRSVAGGVTVVSSDTFVNARPVAKNIVSVPAKELASAPVSRVAGAEPVRASVIGAGTPASNRPPAAAMSRQVVALRTPAPMPSSFAQQETQAGGHLNQDQLVRQQAPGRPVTPSVQATRQTESEDGFRSFTPSGNNQARTAPRVWEEQGTPEPPRSSQSAQRSAQSASGSAASRPAGQPAQQPANWSHPLAKPAPPVQAKNDQQQEEKYSAWHQQKSWSSSGSKTQASSTAKPSSSSTSTPHK